MTIVPLITDASMEYDPYAAEFDRGWNAAAENLAGEYRRGFTDAMLIAFTFMALGAVFVWFVSAALA